MKAISGMISGNVIGLKICEAYNAFCANAYIDI